MSAPRLALFLLAAALSACGAHVHTDFDPQADFGAYRTWAWLAEKSTPTGDVRLDNPMLNERVQRAIAAELGARGYQKAEPARADLRVGYHLALQQKLDAYTIDHVYGYGPRWGGAMVVPETVVTTYEEGTLVIDLVDARRDRLAWRGWTSRRVEPPKDPEESEKRVREVVSQILAKFPPPVGQGG